MLPWILLALLPLLLFLFGDSLLRFACARRELPEGWEEEWIAEKGGDAWRDAARAGREWLARRETEEAEVQSEDGFLLHALLVPHVAPRATAILFHGWRSSWELDFLPALPFLYSLGLQLLLVDERAQGDSEGQWITLGVRERADVSTWTEYVAGRFGEKHPIFLMGSSMGAAAVLLAAADPLAGSVRGIVADSGYVSPYEAASTIWRNRTPFPARFAMWLLDRFARLFAGFDLRGADASEALGKTERAVLFLHGTRDATVPSYFSKRACEACGSEATLVLVEGAGHCMSYLTDRERVEAALRAFVDKRLQYGQ